MITTEVQKTVVFENAGTTGRKEYIEGVCLSTDSKPTDNIGNGSILLEMDTAKLFIFDETGTIWREM